MTKAPRHKTVTPKIAERSKSPKPWKRRQTLPHAVHQNGRFKSQATSDKLEGIRCLVPPRARLRLETGQRRAIQRMAQNDRKHPGLRTSANAVGNVSADSGLDLFAYRKRCRFLRLRIWSSVFQVMLVFLIS